MKLSENIKSISYLKAHASEVARRLAENEEPLIVTQNGEAKMVVQGIECYERTQETLALLKILALGNKQIEQGKVQPASKVVDRLKKRIEEM